MVEVSRTAAGTGLVYAVGTAVELFLVIFFLVSQLKSLGYDGVKSNKCVLLTISGNLAVAINLIAHVFLIFYYSGNVGLLAFSDVLFFVGVLCHTALAYLRSAAVFRTSRKYLTLIKGLVISGFSAGAIGTALELIGVIRFASFALPLTMTMFGVVDVVCTIGFASFTCDTNATLDRHQVQATNLIAKRSVVICSLASASAVLFWIYWGVSIVVDDSTMRILFCFVENLFMAAMMMWVWLKVELDSLANTPFNAINLDQTLSESKFPL
eukprot:TRINITY_DN25561_c0_g1_i1.p1 TRINITY_DN25561_c0_g1~~TRINITY_DN25561_c0_g1_i1.p1  ORF type:complete len:268 (+),score=58.62 TRINITY_DN25561_c0_g1_i1:349-1152(+)